jgi:GH15 family glucan-1,4-alpha-glucosidase
MEKSIWTSIKNYGLIGDCRTAALVSKQGSVDWYCLPHFDSGSVFSALLEPKRGGKFQILPEGDYQSEQAYLDNTNILQTKYQAKTGRARLLDCFSVATEAHKNQAAWPDHELLRELHCEEGELSFQLIFDPRPVYGMQKREIVQWQGVGYACEWSNHLLVFRNNLPDQSFLERKRSDLLEARFTIRKGETFYFSLVYSDEDPTILPPLGKLAQNRIERTSLFWRDWVKQCVYDGPYAEEVRRSALALKLLTFSPSGAIIAAPTSSLPEEIGGVRNWDYRYCWLRDASFIIRALLNLNFQEEAKAFAHWLIHSTRLSRPYLNVMYSIFGDTDLEEESLPHFRGYENSQPVNIGNGAYDQFQLDIYGEMILALYHVAPHMDSLGKETQKMLIGFGKAIEECWKEPDEGIWEMRKEKEHHTHSKVMAWSGLHHLCLMKDGFSKRFKEAEFFSSFRATADEIKEVLYREHLFSSTGTFGRTREDDGMDASLLRLPLVGFCKSSDPVMENLYEEIERNLTENYLIRRYDSGMDGLPGGEGAFLLCNLWMVENLAHADRKDESEKWFKEFLKHHNSVMLWSEEIDPKTEEFLGNYPQGFTHVGLINAALALYRPEKEKAKA